MEKYEQHKIIQVAVYKKVGTKNIQIKTVTQALPLSSSGILSSMFPLLSATVSIIQTCEQKVFKLYWLKKWMSPWCHENCISPRMNCPCSSLVHSDHSPQQESGWALTIHGQKGEVDPKGQKTPRCYLN